MINKTKTLCFTGHRGERLPQTAEGQDALRQSIREEIDKAIDEGIDTFLMGACYGFDLLAASVVLLRQRIIYPHPFPNDAPHIKLIAVVPFEGQASRWNEANRNLF